MLTTNSEIKIHSFNNKRITCIEYKKKKRKENSVCPFFLLIDTHAVCHLMFDNLQKSNDFLYILLFDSETSNKDKKMNLY